MKINNIHISAILLATLFASCGEISPQKTAEIIAKTDSIIVKTIDNSAEYYYVTLDTFIWGPDTASVAVVYDDGKPIQIAYLSEIAVDNEWSFFLDAENGETIYFLETGINLAEGCRFQNQFYYHKHKLIKGETASSDCTHPDHQHNVDWTEYKSLDKENDFRIVPDAVDALVKEIIIAVEADRPNLSPEANAARRKGAAFWATGANNEWNMTITLDQYIHFEYDNGEHKITSFEYRQDSTNSNDSTIVYNGIDNNHNALTVTFSVIDYYNNGFKNPLLTTIRFKEKEYKGSGTFF